MTTDRELMAEMVRAWDSGQVEPVQTALRAMRDRLAQPEPEPVAWQCSECGGTHSLCPHERKDVPLYTAQPQRQWQSLTDAELWRIGFALGEKIPDLMIDLDFARAIEAKLREKNSD